MRRESVQHPQYDLNTTTKNLLCQNSIKIEAPVQVVFSDQVCKDHDWHGDNGLKTGLCQQKKKKQARHYLPVLFVPYWQTRLSVVTVGKTGPGTSVDSGASLQASPVWGSEARISRREKLGLRTKPSITWYKINILRWVERNRYYEHLLSVLVVWTNLWCLFTQSIKLSINHSVNFFNKLAGWRQWNIHDTIQWYV